MFHKQKDGCQVNDSINDQLFPFVTLNMVYRITYEIVYEILMRNRRRSLNIYKLQFKSTSRHRIITTAVTRMSVSRYYMLIRSISAFIARYVCLTRSTPYSVSALGIQTKNISKLEIRS